MQSLLLLYLVPTFLYFHLLCYAIFTHVYRSVLFVMKKLMMVIERATCALCSSLSDDEDNLAEPGRRRPSTRLGRAPAPGSAAPTSSRPGLEMRARGAC